MSESSSELALRRVYVEDAIRFPQGISRLLRRATYAIAEALFLTEEGPPPPERLEWLCDDIDHFFAHAGPRAKTVYSLCVTAISVVAPWLIGRLKLFPSLSLEERVEALTKLEESVLGLAVFGAKAPLCFVYYEHPESAEAIGHDGMCLNGTHLPVVPV